MTNVRCQLLASVASVVLIGAASTASADQLLTGSISSASGQKLEGVQVSAKKEGATITTSVYTDVNGEYFFPAMTDGKYRVWAQALGFETAKNEVELNASKHEDFKLAAITDPEQKIKQMPSEMLAAALPDETEADAQMKRIFHNQCTGCHTPGYPLQFKFDEAGQLPHDGAMGFDGNLYYTVNNPNPGVTVGKVDTRTGEVKYIKVDRKDGKYAATAHGLTRDGNGNLWFDVDPGRRSLGKLDVATEKVSVYETPAPMSPLGGAVTLDVDGKGHIWASAPDGVVAFDPATEKFTDFKSILPYKNAKGTNSTYGAAGDRDGNGWWAQMAFDTIGKADMTTGKTTEISLPSLKDEMARLPETKRAFYENFADRTNGNPLPWAQGPRRMGTDKNADVLWVGNSWGASLARIDTKTGQTSIIPFPDPAYQPYHIAVDQNHNVWGNLWTADRLVKYDPGKAEWTLFDLPVRGTEIRHISLLEKDGVTKVIVPVYRDSMMGVMTLRSDADIAKLKTAAK
jgi:streptogramin lyase